MASPVDQRVVTQFDLMVRGLKQITDLGKEIGLATTRMYDLQKAGNLTQVSLVKDSMKSLAIFEKQKEAIEGLSLKTLMGSEKVSNKFLDKAHEDEFKYLAESIKERQANAAAQQKMAQEIMNSQNKLVSMTAQSAQNEIAVSQQIQEEKNKEIMQSVKLSQQIQQEMIYRNNANILMKESGLNAVELSRGLKNMGIIMTKTGQLTDLFGNKIKKAELNIKQLSKAAWRFNMNMLTLMFGFMALQRIISQFGKSAISTYQKANEDTEGLGKSTWHLQAAWEFFKYSLVDALTQSPLFQMLVQWLLQLVQWFNKLDPAVKQFIAIGLAVLFIIVTVGFLHAQLAPLFSFISTMIPWIAGLLTGTLGAAFWWVAAIVAIVVLLWMTDLGNFRDFFKNTFGILWEVVKMVFKHIWDTIKDVLALIKAIFKGDFDEVYKIIERMWKRSAAFTIKVLHSLSMAFDNFSKWIINTLLDAVQFALNGAIAAINLLIKAMNKVPGINIPLIPKVDLSSMRASYKTVDDIKKDFEAIDKFIGITEEAKAPSIEKVDKKETTKGEDNRTFNFDMDFNIEGSGLDIRQLKDEIMGEFTSELNRVTDVNNT